MVVRELLGLDRGLVFDIGHNDFGEEIDDLGGDCGEVHLVGNPLRVRLELARCQGLLAHRERLCRLAPEIEQWVQDMAERDVDKSRENQGHIGCHEVEYKLFLDQSSVVCLKSFLISYSSDRCSVVFGSLPSMVS